MLKGGNRVALNVEATIRLGLYETKAVVPLQAVAPGTYTLPFHSEGNSLLSTVYVKTADPGASVKVNYWDYTTGVDLTADPGDRHNLQSHVLLLAAGAPQNDRIIVTGLHNKPNLEVIVTGGNVTFGVYVTVVSSFASDLDQNLKFQAQTADLAHDKGLVVSGYDATLGKFFMLPIDNGSVKVTGSFTATVQGSTAGLNATVTTSATPNTETNFTVVGVKRFRFTNRGNVMLKYAFAVGESGTNYATLAPNATVDEGDIQSANITVYIQAPSPSQRIEVVSWS